MNWLLLLIPLLPVSLLILFGWRKRSLPYFSLVVLAPLPALLLALFAPDFTLQIPWILFGVEWQLNTLSRPLLSMTASLWILAGLFAYHYLAADQSRQSFTIFWLLTLLGNLVLIVAQDIASFYTGFAIMTFAGYGLVVHSASAEARHAGRVYLSMAVLGEMLILAGLLMAIPGVDEPLLRELPVAISENSNALLISVLLLAGFGVKAGLPGLHLWLPLAHPVAPTPASAVLSGAMIKAGLLAWLQVLPAGEEAATVFYSPGFAWFVIGLGFIAAFGAAAVGVLQHKTKTVLAYSSISQMGLMTILLGIGLLEPASWPVLLAAILVYMVHHGLTKGALFLSVGLAQYPARWPRALVMLIALLPALALIGAPLSSGAGAKLLMKDSLYELSSIAFLLPFISLAAVATGLLMFRFLWLLWHTQAESKDLPSIRWAVVLSLFSVLFAFWWLPLPAAVPFLEGMALSALFDALWPLLLTLMLGLLSILICRRLPFNINLPAGDLIWPISGLLQRLARTYPALEQRIIAASQSLQSALTKQARRVQQAGTEIFSLRLNEAFLQRHIALWMSLLILLLSLLVIF